VLFLDELPEFRRHVLECIPRPLQDGAVSITRRLVTTSYPARTQLVASQNACPCGFAGSVRRKCLCREDQINRYKARVEAEIGSVFDFRLFIPDRNYRELRGAIPSGETSANVKARVEAARKIQTARYGTRAKTNASMTKEDREQYCKLSLENERIFADPLLKDDLTLEEMVCTIHLARTIADLDGSEDVERDHVLEALSLVHPDEQKARLAS
jgi:magnesium chelatase family protein